ncbi:PopZ family protein [Wolbachia endosymbiont of Tettigetta isshikii]|uniref:PopZ family protein n=1 Tax=Wolbachia endosymbiont of Tettigetta isshikii TaxID=3239093 RepID=UPI0039811F8E
MNDGQSNQSVKDILEDIKKAIFGKNASSDEMEIEKEKEDDDVLYLEEEYLEDSEEDSKEEDNEKNNNVHGKEMVFDNTKFNIHSHNLEEKEEVHLQHNTQMSNKKVDNSSSQTQNKDHLILKDNMEEIKELLERMQSELQHKQQKRVSLTVQELVTSLLKPQLSEWLNKYLHTLVKEVVEKELKDIISNK